MIDWSVKGLGARVIVTSPLGDEYPFAITSVDDLRIELSTAPRWECGREPEDAATRIDDARTVASRWTADTFGAVPRQRSGGAAWPSPAPVGP